MSEVELGKHDSINMNPMISHTFQSTEAPILDFALHKSGETSIVTAPIANINGHITPPLTPNDVQASNSISTNFNTFLRAFYPFTPTSEEDASTITLQLIPGDVVLVHSIHANGWADGTLLASGARGWLPTNYCEGYNNAQIGDLLRALTSFWDSVRSASDGDISNIRKSNYIRGMIVGVRCCLDRTQCLKRDCSSVRSNAPIRRNRRALLSDLSTFVKSTKGLELAIESLEGEGPFDLDLDDLVFKAFRLVTRAVHFVDAWEDFMTSNRLATTQSHGNVPPTPPADQTEFEMRSRSTSIISEPVRGVAPTPRPSASDDTQLIHSTTIDHQTRPTGLRHSTRFSRACRHPEKRISASHPIGQNALHRSSQTSHRISLITTNRSSPRALEQLNILHNTFLTYLGYFIGLQIQARSSSDLLSTTKQAVLACRDLLDIITEVWDRDWRQSHVLSDARDDMYRKIALLAEAARDLFRPLQDDDEDAVIPVDGKLLMDAATACVRAAGDCVAECHRIIELIGDFDFVHMREADASEPARSPLYQRNTQDEITYQNLTTDKSSANGNTCSDIPCASLCDRGSFTYVENARSSLYPAIDSQQYVPQVQLGFDPSGDVLLPPLPDCLPAKSSQSEKFVARSSRTSINSTSGQRGLRKRNEIYEIASVESSFENSSSLRNSEQSTVSQSSTRATSPTSSCSIDQQGLQNVMQAATSADSAAETLELEFVGQSYEEELVYNQDGQIIGGTLPAFVEQLTAPNSTPDAVFVSAVYLTFRLFTTPKDFAQALIDRFNYIGECPQIASPVRLRVYNVFKKWLESYWRTECDQPALEIITTFASHTLEKVLPTAGKRLRSLAEQGMNSDRLVFPRQPSSLARSASFGTLQNSSDSPLPAPVMSKSQTNLLKSWRLGACSISVADFDPLEIARQLTLKEAPFFCAIRAEELLDNDDHQFTDLPTSNVRALSRLSTDLSNWVIDTILQHDDFKKRAVAIKRWIKVAEKLVELSNYHSFLAVMCSLTLSIVQRLKRTWECISPKTKGRFEKLRMYLNVERNSAFLRQTLQKQSPPCIPYVGMYRTDIEFASVGCPKTRQINVPGTTTSREVINFDRYLKLANVIRELQRFQMPYQLQEVADLQAWIEEQLVRVRNTDQTAVTREHYRKSLLLEPRPVQESGLLAGNKEKTKLDLSFLGLRDKVILPSLPSVQTPS